MQFFKIILGCLLLWCFGACSKIKTVVLRDKGKVVMRYQVIRKTKVQHGYEKVYFRNGKLDGELYYENGVHHGDFTYYHEENGAVKQKGTYVKGKIEGYLITFYPNGQTKEEIMHVNGLTQGAFKEYNEEGHLLAEGFYTSDDEVETLEQGLLKLYDENGLLIKKMLCRAGICCTIWTKEDGDVAPKNNLCTEIIDSLQEEKP